MNKTELVAALADQVGLPTSKAGQVLDAVFALLADEIQWSGSVRTDLGTFEVRERPSRMAFGALVGPTVGVGFRPSADLKARQAARA